jgi:single-strand DNA-binding protein
VNDLNSILIEGELIKDAVHDKTPKDIMACTFTIASTRCYKSKTGLEKETGYFEIQVFGKLAEASHNLAHQGRRVRVVGRIKQNRWNDIYLKPHSKMVIVAEHIEYRPAFQENKSQEAENNEQAH